MRRARTRLQLALLLAAHAVATKLARGGLRLTRRRSPHAASPRRKVSILLMHAWGMGGTIRATLNLAAHLGQNDDVEIISIVRRRTTPRFTFPPGVKFTAVDDQRAGRNGRLARVLASFPGLLAHPSDGNARSPWTLLTDLRLLRLLRRAQPDVLVGTRPALNLLALWGAPPGAAVIGIEHMNYRSHTPMQRTQILKRYPALDAVVVLTKDDLEDYLRVLPGVRLVRIPNPIPDSRGRLSPLDAPVAIAAGRLIRQKGFDRLIPAFAAVAERHPDWTLLICGDGPKRRRLNRLIKRHGLDGKVVLAGSVPDLDARLEASSFFVLSSRFEGLPMVMLEAMSKGLPVVGFDCPTGPAEVIESGTDGILVEQGDIEALAAGMNELIDDPAKRRRLGAAAARKAAAFSASAVGRQWEELIALLTDASDGRGARARAQEPSRPPAS